MPCTFFDMVHKYCKYCCTCKCVFVNKCVPSSPSNVCQWRISYTSGICSMHDTLTRCNYCSAWRQFQEHRRKHFSEMELPRAGHQLLLCHVVIPDYARQYVELVTVQELDWLVVIKLWSRHCDTSLELLVTAKCNRDHLMDIAIWQFLVFDVWPFDGFRGFFTEHFIN